VALLVTHEYLRTKEHNDSTSFYLIDLYRVSVKAILEVYKYIWLWISLKSIWWRNITMRQPCTSWGGILPKERWWEDVALNGWG
jgi:hypothetical protein